MCQDAHTIDLDDEVVAYPATLVGGGVFDHALMEFGFYFEADDFALFHYATGGDIADEEGLLTLVAGILGRVVAGGLDACAGVAPRPLLADVAEGLKTDGGLFCGHSSLF